MADTLVHHAGLNVSKENAALAAAKPTKTLKNQLVPFTQLCYKAAQHSTVQQGNIFVATVSQFSSKLKAPRPIRCH